MRTLFRLGALSLALALGAVATPSGSSQSVSPVRLGPTTTYVAPPSVPNAMASGDLNGDGRPDIVIAGAFSNTVEVRLNQGGTVFGPATSYPLPATGAAAIALADVGQLVAASTGVGPGKSLLSKALAARAAYQSGDRATSCSMLADYVSEVRAQSGKRLTVSQAAALTALATDVRAGAGC